MSRPISTNYILNSLTLEKHYKQELCHALHITHYPSKFLNDAGKDGKIHSLFTYRDGQRV